MFIIMVIISIIFEYLLCTRSCSSCFIHYLIIIATLCNRGVITCVLLIRGPKIFSGTVFQWDEFSTQEEQVGQAGYPSFMAPELPLLLLSQNVYKYGLFLRALGSCPLLHFKWKNSFFCLYCLTSAQFKFTPISLSSLQNSLRKGHLVW